MPLRPTKPEGEGQGAFTRKQEGDPLKDGFALCHPPDDRPSMSSADIMNDLLNYQGGKFGPDYPPIGERAKTIDNLAKPSKVSSKPGVGGK